MVSKQFLTQEGYEKLLQELNNLVDDKLPEVLKRLKEASEQGDISENAEYDEALARKELLEARIGEIERLVSDVEIIQKKSKKKDTVVGYGSFVKLKFDDGIVYDVEIVGTGEVDIDDSFKISLQSPIGSAIRNKKVGDIVKVRLIGSRKEVTIIAID